MPRTYTVEFPDSEPQVAKNPSKAADLIRGKHGSRDKGKLVHQLAAMQNGDSLIWNDEIRVIVSGGDDEEEHELPIPPEGPAEPGVPPAVDEK